MHSPLLMLESLLPETKGILADVMERTGCTIRLIPRESTYLSRALISLHLANSNQREFVIAFNPTAKALDYDIAHEAIRFLRFTESPLDRKYVLISDPQTRAYAYRQMEDDLKNIDPEYQEHTRKGFGYFYDGILTQLLSIPVDFWINKRLYNEYPDFKGELLKGLEEIFERAHQDLEETLERIAPRTVYRATNGMSAAFALFASELTGIESFYLPYSISKFDGLASELKESNSDDRGHPGDKDATNRWADILGLKDWYEWRRARDIENSPHEHL